MLRPGHRGSQCFALVLLYLGVRGQKKRWGSSFRRQLCAVEEITSGCVLQVDGLEAGGEGAQHCTSILLHAFAYLALSSSVSLFSKPTTFCMACLALFCTESYWRGSRCAASVSRVLEVLTLSSVPSGSSLFLQPSFFCWLVSFKDTNTFNSAPFKTNSSCFNLRFLVSSNNFLLPIRAKS